MKKDIELLFNKNKIKSLKSKERNLVSQNKISQNKISQNKEEIMKKVGDKVFDLLSKYRYGGYNKMNLNTEINYLIYSSHEKVLQKSIETFFKKDFLTIKIFLKELNLFFEKEVLDSYKFILKEKQKSGIYKFTDKEIDNHINSILSFYGIYRKKLQNITGVDHLDFDDKESNINIEIFNKGNFKEMLNNISEIRIKEIRIPDEFFEKIVEQFIPKLILDFKNIFGNIRFGNKDFSEGTNVFYNLDVIYKYDSNIFLYINAINKVLEKNIDIIHNNLCNLIKVVGNDKVKEFKNLISYNTLKRYLRNISYLK